MPYKDPIRKREMGRLYRERIKIPLDARTWRVYVIRNVTNGLQYVGVTSRPLARRWSSHLSDARHDRGTLLHADILKYGREQFTYRQLNIALNEAGAEKLEQFWIRELGSLAPAGYNLAAGGKGRVGSRPSSSTRVKMSLAALAHGARLATKESRRRAVQNRNRDANGAFLPKGAK